MPCITTLVFGLTLLLLIPLRFALFEVTSQLDDYFGGVTILLNQRIDNQTSLIQPNVYRWVCDSAELLLFGIFWITRAEPNVALKHSAIVRKRV